jgi:hypothetical protein
MRALCMHGWLKNWGRGGGCNEHGWGGGSCLIKMPSLISCEGDGLARLPFPESDPRYLRYGRYN